MKLQYLDMGTSLTQGFTHNKYIPYVHMHVHPNGLSNNDHDIQLKAEHVFVWEGCGSLSPYWYMH